MFAKKFTLSLLGLAVLTLVTQAIVFTLASEGSESFIAVCPLH